MIRGIGGKPFINLDEHIDIAEFKSLHYKICKGISPLILDKLNLISGFLNPQDGVFRDGSNPLPSKLKVLSFNLSCNAMFFIILMFRINI